MAKAKIERDGCWVTIVCPACREIEIEEGYSDPIAGQHSVPFKPHVRGWDFNGDVRSPTLSPSLLRTHTVTDDLVPKLVCHSFIRDGRIEYLGDCTHRFAGQTVELPEIE